MLSRSSLSDYVQLVSIWLSIFLPQRLTSISRATLTRLPVSSMIFVCNICTYELLPELRKEDLFSNFANVHFGSVRIVPSSQRISRELDPIKCGHWTPGFVSSRKVQWRRLGGVDHKSRMNLLITIGSLETDTGRGGGFGSSSFPPNPKSSRLKKLVTGGQTGCESFHVFLAHFVLCLSGH